MPPELSIFVEKYELYGFEGLPKGILKIKRISNKFPGKSTPSQNVDVATKMLDLDEIYFSNNFCLLNFEV